jgi:peptidoglycan/LPS O-acetylase OafA/YrhL
LLTSASAQRYLKKLSLALNSERINIPALTGIRAVAAYMIFIHNYMGANCIGQFWCPLVLEFHSGVSIFFVLSGFLITYNYYGKSSFNVSWLKKYYISRIARIYPPYFFVAVLSLIMLNSPIIEWLVSLSLLQGLSSNLRFIGVSQSWTLTVELVFYLIAPFLFLLDKRKASLSLQFVLVFLIGILISSKGYIENIGEFMSGYIYIYIYIYLFVYTFFGRSFDFFVGIFLGKLILSNRKIPPLKFIYIGLIGIGFVLAIISNLQSVSYRFGIYSPNGLFIYNFVLPIIIGIFFLGLIKEKTYVSKILSFPLVVLLGEASYAFYLIHLPVFADLIPKFWRVNLFVFFGILNIVAIGLFLFIERPMNKAIKSLVLKD